MNHLYIRREVATEGMPKTKGTYWVEKDFWKDGKFKISQSYFDGTTFGSEYVTAYLEPVAMPDEKEILEWINTQNLIWPTDAILAYNNWLHSRMGETK